MSGVLTDTSILAGAAGAVSGYDIDNSCRFDALNRIQDYKDKKLVSLQVKKHLL